MRDAPVKLYDFKRPDKFSKDQIRTVAIMHETFARQTTAALSSALRTLAHVHVAFVDQLTYEEFIRAIPNPTTLAIIAMDPLKGSAVLEIDPPVTSAIIDRLFGGQGEGPAVTRELTDIESAVMEGLIARLMGTLREAWATVIDLHPRLTLVENNPMFAQVVPPSEMVVLVVMEVRIGGAKGMMNLCLPYLTIEPVIPLLSAQFIYSQVRRSAGPEKARALLDHLESLGISSEVCALGAPLSLREIGSLKKGSRLRIPGGEPSRAFLRMGGHPLFDLVMAPGAGGTAPSYEVSGEAKARMLPDREAARKTSELTEVEKRLRASLNDIATRMDTNLSSLANGISDMRRKQDAMADQLAFTPPEPEAEAGRSPARLRPFDFVRRADAAQFQGLIQQEHPQLIALVLSYLDPHMASAVLGSLPAELQPEVARRIAAMGRTVPDVLREVERVLEHKLSVLSSEDYILAGGVDSLVEILSVADRSTEKNVVESLQQKDPALAEELKRTMFVFEDILLLDRESMARLLEKAGVEDVLRAMKAASEEVQRFLWEHLPGGEKETLRKRYEEMGRPRLSEVERAQVKIVAFMREMDETGEIVVARPRQPSD